MEGFPFGWWTGEAGDELVDGSVLVGESACDVRRGKQGEDVGLQNRTSSSRKPITMTSSHARMPAGFTRNAGVQQQVLATDGEERQQQVAGEHVGEESQGQRDRPDDQVGQELERHQERQDRPVTPAGPTGA